MTGFRRPSAPTVALVFVGLALLATCDERILGTVTDEQVLLSTSFALAHGDGIGVARGASIATARPQGDAVAAYGVLWPSVLAPAIALAGPFERTFGAGTSQALLILVPLLLVLGAAAAAGALAREAGAGNAGQVIAVVGAGLASPLAAYASTAFTEPLQALLLVSAVLLAARRRAVSAGACAGLAVLAKSVNLVVVPCVLLPLVFRGDRASVRLLVRACLGIVPLLVASFALDLMRFGRPLAGYAGQHFSHPPLDGAWRLLVGPSEGLLTYFPLLALAIVTLPRLVARKESRGVGLAASCTFGALLVTCSAWWAWDGSSGWGPRLLVPIVPLLAAAAGSAVDASRARLGAAVALLLLGVGVTSIGLVQSDIATSYYLDSCGSVDVPEERAAWYPEGFSRGAPPGQRRITRTMAAASDAAFAPLRTSVHLLRARVAGGPRREELLAEPPWLAEHPDAVPQLSGVDGALSGVLRRYLAEPFRWPHWGAVLAAPDDERHVRFHRAFEDAAIDQAWRALDVGRFDRAEGIAREQWEIGRSQLAAAIVLESLRLQGRKDDFVAFLRGLDASTGTSAAVDVVLALAARDLGQPQAARAALAAAAPAYPTEAMRRALASDPNEWPATWRELTR